MYTLIIDAIIYREGSLLIVNILDDYAIANKMAA